MKKENVLLKYINDYLKDKDSDIYQEVRKQLEYNLKLNELDKKYQYDIFEALDYHLNILKAYLKSFKEPLYLEKAFFEREWKEDGSFLFTFKIKE